MGIDRNYNNFNIADAFQTAFGIRPPSNYVVPKHVINPQKGNSNNEAFVIPTKTDIGTQTLTGTPLSATDVFGRSYYLPVILAGNYLPFPVLTPELDKKIIYTSLTEQRGDVNMIISNGDVKISIKGIIYRPDGAFPEFEIALLNNLFLMQQSLIIQNAITDILLQTDGGQASTNVIITRLKFLPAVGKAISYRPYEMELKSDFIQTLEITE